MVKGRYPAEELAQDPPHISGIWWSATLTIALGARDRQIPGTHWPGCFLKTTNLRFSEILSHKVTHSLLDLLQGWVCCFHLSEHFFSFNLSVVKRRCDTHVILALRQSRMMRLAWASWGSLSRLKTRCDFQICFFPACVLDSTAERQQVPV